MHTALRVRECLQCGACYADDSVEICAADQSALDLPFPGPNVIDGKYLIERRVGEGGMGVVYAARHLALHRPVAVKVIRAPVGQSGHFLERFRREAEALGKLEHPNIVNVTDFGIDPRGGGLPYLVMEYLAGVTLDALTVSGGMHPDQAFPIFAAVATAIDYAHERGFIHRDLKPGNVFIAESANGAARVPKILDFGLVARTLAPETAETLPDLSRRRAESATPSDEVTAKIATMREATAFARTETATRSGSLMGTIGYIAPELLGGRPASAASDLYALGVLIYVTLTGTTPFDSEGLGLLNAQLTRDPVPPSQRRRNRNALPQELDAPILALLARSADERPRSATAAVDEIERAWRAAQRRQWLRSELPRRTVIALAASLGATLSLFLLRDSAPIARVESKLIDLRFRATPLRPPDPRILLAVFDEATLRAGEATLADRADEVGTRLAAAIDAGASGVAVDLLLPGKWRASKPFLDLLLRHPNRVVLAAQSGEGGVIGTEPVGGVVSVALGPEKAAQMFGFVEMPVGGDGVTRHATLARETVDGRLHDSFAARAASMLGAPQPRHSGPFLLDYRVDVARYERISWKDFEAALASRPERFRGAVVVVGAEFTGSGDEFHRIPVAPHLVSGVTVQAVAIDTVAAGLPVRSERGLGMFAATAVAAAAILLMLLTRRRATLPLAIGIAALAAIVAAAVLVVRDSLVMVPAAAPMFVVIVVTLLGMLLRETMSRVPQ